MNTDLQIIHGDNREVLKGFADNTFHAIVTDPPYELGFMGHRWDRSGIAYDPAVWSQCLRVLKPGGYLLSFGGSRTYHRMACAIEDCDFEIRDMIEWLYGSGFPKSMDVSKAMDKKEGAKREVVGHANYTVNDKRGGAYASEEATQRDRLAVPITQPSTINAQLWSGYGTALKPAHEPICVARKALDGTVVENVLKWGCGAVNIDGSRIECEPIRTSRNIALGSSSGGIYSPADKPSQFVNHKDGRFPANLILDSDAAALLDLQSGQNCGAAAPKRKGHSGASKGIYQDFASKGDDGKTFYGDAGGAARFFQRCDFTDEERELNLQFALRFYYTAKASGTDRGNNTKAALPLFDVPEEVFRNSHPTVKPIALMKYLLRLVVPGAGEPIKNSKLEMQNGSRPRVLDPFLGSGTTAVACRELGIDCTGIELQAEHMTIIHERLGLKV